METLTLTAGFDADSRPTCLVDLHAADRPWSSRIVYQNPALQRQCSSHFLDELSDSTHPTGAAAWIHDYNNRGSISARDGASPHHTYIIRERWRVIQWRETASRKQSLLAERDSALADRDAATQKLETLRHMMETINVGMFEYDWKGKLLWGNEAFYKLSGHPRESKSDEITWEQSVFPEDHAWLLTQWQQMAAGKSVTLEMRWRKTPHTGTALEVADKGDEQWVVATCVPVFDETGEVVSVTGCLTDIDRLKRTEFSEVRKKNEALEQAVASEHRLSAFADMTNIGIWMMDLNDKVYYCNREWFSVAGHPQVPINEVDWNICVSAETKEDFKARKAVIFRTKKPLQYEIELLRSWKTEQGEEMPARAMIGAYPQLDENGEVTGLAGTMTDVTHIRWAEIQKQRTEDALETQRQRENFIDMTCHEIRNPLGAVVHCAALIRSSIIEIMDEMSRIKPLANGEGGTPTALVAQFESVLDVVNIIDNCCAHQKRIVDDILTVSKLDSKLLRIAPTPIYLNKALLDLSSMLEADAQKADVQLCLNFESSLDEFIGDREVLLDFGRVTQVLINLVTNSIKFTQSEQIRMVNVKVGATRERPLGETLGVKFVPPMMLRDDQSETLLDRGGGEPSFFLYFVVADTGCGFDSAGKNRLFERFKQESVRTYSKYGGSGLGLFISREISELQGGEIGAYSKPGEGATFAFYVKTCTTGETSCNSETRGIDAANGSTRRMELRDTRILPTSQTTDLLSTPQKYTILIVEDNLVNQKVLRLQLQKLGHTVFVAGHGGEALAFLETTSAWRDNPASELALSVVLMDTEMPVMGGVECARRIREAQAEGRLTKYLPIISVSANARDAQINCALECGMDDAISKPFRVPELMPMITRLVEKHSAG